MRLILNVIWLVFSGFWLFLGYILARIIACIWPFGRDVVPSSRSGITSGVGNVIWFVVAGWWLAIGHVLTSVPLALTIIGLPMAWANIKMIPVTCFPFGTEVVSARR